MSRINCGILIHIAVLLLQWHSRVPTVLDVSLPHAARRKRRALGQGGGERRREGRGSGGRREREIQKKTGAWERQTCTKVRE